MTFPTFRSTFVASAAAALLATAVAGPAHAQTAPRKPLSAHVPMQLPESGSRGQRAIDLLGKRLPEVAAWYRKSPEQLRELLLTDSRLRLDRQGRLYVVDELDRKPSQHEAVTKAAGEGVVPLDQTFTLHSRPGAARTIYLDFNGAVLVNTAWNSGGNTLNAQPFDADGNTGSFSDDELERIQGIWQRVAEDFAPFDVDVTTQEPAPDALTRSSLSDTTYGTTALITNRSGVYDCGCGGVAYIGIYDDTSDFYKPALVFWDALGPSDEKSVAEATSHEIGHNIGLNHDGYAGGGYYPGHGSGETGWAPIMGVGYSQSLVQWSKGQYSTANNLEDDFLVAQDNGLPLRADDHGNDIATATALSATPSGSTSQLSGAGVIGFRSDLDYFSFASGAGSATITLTPDERSANLDPRLTIRDAAGNVIVRSNPPDALAASVSFTVPSAGTYFVTVNGVGKGDLLGTGYSGYGSVGQYKISGSVPAP
jgi:Bacterial pre-peptidase C-terminal domain/Metallo-peptidase family M12B Reprolysin-like